MPEPLFVEETGRALRLNAGFDMSSNTELSIIFCKPGGTTVTKTTADGVALGTSTITDEDLGTLTANEYVEYSIESDLITSSDAGRWSAQLLYTNIGETPDDNLYGTIAYFTVSERCNT
jgi:hypothetical protein